MNTVEVPVQSGWWSKINWTQIVALVASVLVFMTGGKFNLSVEMQAAIVVVIQAVQSLVTVILRLFFTQTVTPSSASRMSP